MSMSSTYSKHDPLTLCALVLTAALCACGGENDTSTNESAAGPAQAVQDESQISWPRGVAPDASVYPGLDPATSPEASSDEVIVEPETETAAPPSTTELAAVGGNSIRERRALRLSWAAPRSNDDGTPLTDLSGYRIYLGTASGSYAQSIVAPAAVTSYLFPDLAPGTWYAVVKAINSSGLEGEPSNEASKVLR